MRVAHTGCPLLVPTPPVGGHWGALRGPRGAGTSPAHAAAPQTPPERRVGWKSQPEAAGRVLGGLGGSPSSAPVLPVWAQHTRWAGCLKHCASHWGDFTAIPGTPNPPWGAPLQSLNTQIHTGSPTAILEHINSPWGVPLPSLNPQIHLGEPHCHP